MKWIKGEKGSTVLVTPLIWVISILIFLFFLVTSLNVIEPFVIYQKISETSLKYIFIMEEYGYLTDRDRVKLKEELISKGLKGESITIRATSDLQDYGTPISLIINYKHSMNLPSFEESFIPRISPKEINLKVFKRSFSKR